MVTGGGRGIGAATARQLARRGYRVCVNYLRRAPRAAEVVAAISKAGGEAIAVQADVSSELDVIRLFETVDDQLGPLTALVNNAGIVFPQTMVENMDADRINRVLSTNVTGSFLCCREAIRRMSTNHGGHGGSIVNVSSVAARLGSAGEYVDYAASKAAIDTLTRGLSLEVAGQGIREPVDLESWARILSGKGHLKGVAIRTCDRLHGGRGPTVGGASEEPLRTPRARRYLGDGDLLGDGIESIR